MDCTNAQSVLDIYLDGELDAVRSLEIEDHLHACAHCLQSYNYRHSIRAGLKANSFYFKAPADLKRRIQRSVRDAADAEAPARWFSRSWIKIAAPLAAAALVVLTLVPLLSGPSSDELLNQEVVASHIRSLMVNHLADVSSTDKHTVKPWFNGKLDFSPPVIDLARQGFPLIGGRLDYLNNRPVAALVYRRDKHIINAFVWPAEKGSPDGGAIETRQGYNVMRWTGSGMNFWLVSDLEESQLTKFTELLKSSAESGSIEQSNKDSQS
jgi:anti-sigma factor (TIGR02949 family)